MNRVDIHNYEAYLLDALEGRLGREEQQELDAFMALHPELAIDLEGLEEMTLDLPQTVFEGKTLLKKTGSDLVPEEQFISYIEQQLSPEERLALERSCAGNAALARELSLYQHTIATADTGIVYGDKEKLKRKARLIAFDFRTLSAAAAASVALLLMLYVLRPAPGAQMIHNTYARYEIRKSGKAKGGDTNRRALPETQHPASQKQERHILNHSAATGQPGLVAQQQQQQKPVQTPGLQPDTATSGLAVKPKEALKIQEPVRIPGQELIASASHKTTVDVIIENEEEDADSTVKQQGFWALAGKTLKGLNKAGVKTVNGKEESSRDNSAYMLTLGALHITHKSH